MVNKYILDSIRVIEGKQNFFTSCVDFLFMVDIQNVCKLYREAI